VSADGDRRHAWIASSAAAHSPRTGYGRYSAAPARCRSPGGNPGSGSRGGAPAHRPRGGRRGARDLDDSFTARIPEIQKGWLQKADERADKTIAEIERRYGERHERLRDLAEEREDEALNAAFQVLIDTRL
jgi:hypothetical protein